MRNLRMNGWALLLALAILSVLCAALVMAAESAGPAPLTDAQVQALSFQERVERFGADANALSTRYKVGLAPQLLRLSDGQLVWVKSETGEMVNSPQIGFVDLKAQQPPK